MWGPGLRHTMTHAVRAAVRKARAEGAPLPLPPQPGLAPGHMGLVGWLRAAVTADAWLLREWSEILVAQRRFPEAAAHFEARTWPRGALRAALLDALIPQALHFLDAQKCLCGQFIVELLFYTPAVWFAGRLSVKKYEKLHINSGRGVKQHCNSA